MVKVAKLVNIYLTRWMEESVWNVQLKITFLNFTCPHQKNPTNRSKMLILSSLYLLYLNYMCHLIKEHNHFRPLANGCVWQVKDSVGQVNTEAHLPYRAGELRYEPYMWGISCIANKSKIYSYYSPWMWNWCILVRSLWLDYRLMSTRESSI